MATRPVPGNIDPLVPAAIAVVAKDNGVKKAGQDGTMLLGLAVPSFHSVRWRRIFHWRSSR